MQAGSYQSAVVLGLGTSGFAAASLLLEEGTRVVVADHGRGADVSVRAEQLREKGATVRLGVEGMARIPSDAWWQGGAARRVPDVCIVSPGIPDNSPWLGPLHEHGVPVLAELELGASRCGLPIVAVTGSNGKSTFVKLCGLAMESNGLRPALCGNYGKPLCAVAREQERYDWVIAEVSSFQLEHVDQFAPKVGVLLNLAPDHLDRHGDMARYVQLKSRLFDRMTTDAVAVVYDHISDAVQSNTTGSPSWVTFGRGAAVDYRYEGGSVQCTHPPSGAVLSLSDTPFDNPVTGLTAAAVTAVFHGLGLALDGLQVALRTYQPLPHRMQHIAEKAGILFVDDSKATNLAALCGALRMVTRPVHLIAGGQFKEKDAELPKELLAKTTKSAYLVGESAEMLGKVWGGLMRCHQCGSLARAVSRAWVEAESGDVVLLSPGCASFDQFSGYQERGQAFQSLVAQLPDSRENT